MLRIIIALFILTITSTAASSQSWNCRNEVVEIQCSDGKCEQSKTHTPMDVSFNPSGKMNICAYSGCWQGQSTGILFSGTFLTMTSENLKWNAKPEGKATAATLTIDRAKLTATIMVEGFAHPMTCETRK